MGIGGRMYNWVRAFLTDRTFRVKVGADISNYFEIENGIPQGSAVSPILFNIMINDILTCLDTCIQSALYADDGAIWMRGRHAPYLMENIARAIKKVERWSYNWGFKMSESKSCYMIFTNKRKIDGQQLTLYDVQ